ncbi:hypothetical protein [Leptolyngbya sp. FACHB-711]|uniref:hypothetical protein n=1 Tax=unclassified Leptolyngbya TaxID=2650499 RepID=UPI00168A2F50|nr:hypothetical protein [Leptolyngbya sp. FACHB-711]MBD1848478.1 hypothetical protein [Cyanobacteria bacterium FACHB-502]MBD2024960.1 hypothetical protein [Leptolyngbya sp. FACHB-711]
MKTLHKVGLVLGAFTVVLGGTFAYWRTTPSYALFDIGYLSKDLKSRVDIKEISTQTTDAVVAYASKEATATLQTSQNGFEQLGTMIGLGMLQQMRPIIEQQIRTKLEESITDLDQSAKKGSFKVLSINRMGNEALVSVLNPSGQVVEFQMTGTNGYWRFTGLSDASLAKFIDSLKQSPSTLSETPTTTPSETPVTPTPLAQTATPATNPVKEPGITAPAATVNSSSVSRSQDVASANFNAEVFDPPSNCRAQPETGRVVKVFAKGIIKVNPDRHLPGAEDWYYETYQNCWIHQSQFRWLPKAP